MERNCGEAMAAIPRAVSGDWLVARQKLWRHYLRYHFGRLRLVAVGILKGFEIARTAQKLPKDKCEQMLGSMESYHVGRHCERRERVEVLAMGPRRF